MSDTDILAQLTAILEKVVKKPVQITLDTDMIEEGILDSLDGMVFMLEVEQAFGKAFPEDIDLVAEGYYRVRKLVGHLKG